MLRGLLKGAHRLPAPVALAGAAGKRFCLRNEPRPRVPGSAGRLNGSEDEGMAVGGCSEITGDVWQEAAGDSVPKLQLRSPLLALLRSCLWAQLPGEVVS